MFISVVIPVFHDWKNLQKCLYGLSIQSLSSVSFEIIVVNNDPQNPVPEDFLVPSNCKIVTEQSPGSYAARNTGAKASCGDILCFTDADCIPDSDWLKYIRRYYSEFGLNRLVSGKVEMFSDERSLGKLNFSESYDYTFGINQDLYAKKGVAATANLSIPKGVFEKVGGFDASLFSGGDGKFCKDATKMGFKLIYIEDVVVKHPLRKDIASLVIKARRMAGGYISKNGLLKGTYMLAPPVVRLKILFNKDQRMLSKIKSFVVLVLLKMVQVHYFFTACILRERAERR